MTKVVGFESKKVVKNYFNKYSKKYLKGKVLKKVIFTFKKGLKQQFCRDGKSGRYRRYIYTQKFATRQQG